MNEESEEGVARRKKDLEEEGVKEELKEGGRIEGRIERLKLSKEKLRKIEEGGLKQELYEEDGGDRCFATKRMGLRN